MPALGMQGCFKDNEDRTKDYAIKIAENYEEMYHNHLMYGTPAYWL